jgi:hypothetical protein
MQKISRCRVLRLGGRHDLDRADRRVRCHRERNDGGNALVSANDTGKLVNCGSVAGLGRLDSDDERTVDAWAETLTQQVVGDARRLTLGLAAVITEAESQ